MASTQNRYARLDRDSLGRIRALEENLGACLVAFDTEYQIADLSREELTQVQALEQELGVALVCYRPS